MDERVTSTTVTFLHPFSLNVVGELPAGSFTIETVEEPIPGLSFLAYRRVSTAIVLSADGGLSRQVVPIDPQELDAAKARDAAVAALSGEHRKQSLQFNPMPTDSK
jgi:hypothetical protein